MKQKILYSIIVTTLSLITLSSHLFAQKTVKSSITMETPESASGLTSFTIDNGDKSYLVIRDKDKIAHIFIGNKRIPEDKFGDYTAIIKQLDTQTHDGMANAPQETVHQKDITDSVKKEAEPIRNGDHEIKNEEQKFNDREMRKGQEDMKKQEKLIRSVISDLMKEGIIQNSSSLSAFVLTNDVLAVNRQLLPPEIRDKFKAKYLKSPDSMVSLALSNFK